MNKRLKALISLFWTGDLSAEKRERLWKELSENGHELRERMEDDFGHIAEPEHLHSKEEYQAYFQQILARTAGQPLAERKVSRLSVSLVMAACLLLCLGVGYLLWKDDPLDTQTTQPLADLPAADSIIVLHNDAAESRLFSLSDGSSVELTPGSSVQHSTSYGHTERHIELLGKAKFSVVSDSLRPFIVHSSGYTTTALGTSFIVDAQQTSRVNIELLSGRVVVRSTDKTPYPIADQYLSPGDQVDIQVERLVLKRRTRSREIPSLEQQFVSSSPSAKDPSPLSEGLQFENTPLPEVFEQISRYRAVQLFYSREQLARKYFTGAFSKDDDLDQMLTIITLMNDLTYRRASDGIHIEKQNGEH